MSSDVSADMKKKPKGKKKKKQEEEERTAEEEEELQKQKVRVESSHLSGWMLEILFFHTKHVNVCVCVCAG